MQANMIPTAHHLIHELNKEKGTKVILVYFYLLEDC